MNALLAYLTENCCAGAGDDACALMPQRQHTTILEPQE
jgi:hypothetical protein